jgi:hypothetical protein
MRPIIRQIDNNHDTTWMVRSKWKPENKARYTKMTASFGTCMSEHAC